VSPQAATSERALQALAGLEPQALECNDAIPTYGVARERARQAFEALRAAGFDQNTFVTCVDHYPDEPRFEVVWQWRSYVHGERVRLACRVAGSDAWVPSCCDLWPGADWSEREAWDMFGVRFEGHPDLRRLLMPEGYIHHPLRKDFPHRGIEPDRLYREWDRERRERWLAGRPDPSGLPGPERGT
jgi:NADH-quinone oxidoreductase subunit C